MSTILHGFFQQGRKNELGSQTSSIESRGGFFWSKQLLEIVIANMPRLCLVNTQSTPCQKNYAAIKTQDGFVPQEHPS
jgi:hypothetical protein